MADQTLNVTIRLVDKASDKLKKTTGAVNELKSALGALGLGLVLRNVIKTVSEFEKGMVNVTTLLDKKTLPAIEGMEKGLIAIGKETGTSLNELTEGLFFVVSAGIKAGEAVEFLDSANKLAIAGATSNRTAIAALVGTMKAYGEESLNAAEISDLLFNINKKGFTTFEEIAVAMPKVASTANLLGVKQRELAAAMATLVGATGNADEVTTQLNSTFKALAKPSTEMKNILKEMGFESGFAAVEALGLEETLQGLRTTSGGTDESFSKLFNNIRALKGAIPLAGALAGKFTENLQEMALASGATEEAFAKQMDTFDRNLKTFMVTLDVLKVQVGGPMMKVLELSMKGWMMWFDIVGEGFEALKVLAISAWDAIQLKTMQVTEWYASIVEKYQTFFTLLGVALLAFKTVWDIAWNTMKNTMAFVWNAIKTINLTFTETIKSIISVFLAVLKLDWETAWNGIKEIFSSIWEGIKDIASSAVNSIINIVSGAIEKIQTAISKLKELIGLSGSDRTGTDLLKPSTRERLAGTRAGGGSVTAGRTYLVGEKGAEEFTPSTSGVITPNNKLGGSTVINISGIFGSDAAEELGDMIVNRLNMHSATL